MIDFERDELQENPEWRRVLEAYEPIPRAASEADGWIARVSSIAGIRTERLPRIHGKLIALGLLKFQIAGRENGICYQLSTLGRNVLSGSMPNPDDLVEHADEAEVLP